MPSCIRARALTGLALVLIAAPAGARQVAAGKAAPEIELPTLAGPGIKLSTLRGHPVVVTFWGTWCPPCRIEFPELSSAYRKYRESGLEILAVNQFDQELGKAEVKAFVKEFSVEFPVALDERGKSRRSFRLIGLPTTVFIDKAGIIQHVTSGPLSAAELGRGLATIVAPKE